MKGVFFFVAGLAGFIAATVGVTIDSWLLSFVGGGVCGGIFVLGALAVNRDQSV